MNKEYILTEEEDEDGVIIWRVLPMPTEDEWGQMSEYLKQKYSI